MRVRFLFVLVFLVMFLSAQGASAQVVHVVAPGESLYSVAAADGLSVNQLAAANGLSPGALLVAGSTIQIPPQAGGSSGYGDGDDDADDVGATPTQVATPATGSSSSSGAYVVQPGDSLSAIAARAGMSVAELAAVNGLNPNAPLLYGTVLRLSGASTQSPTSSAASTAVVAGAESQPVGASAEGAAYGAPYPTPERLTASQIGSIAAANGVPASLADAVAWQESGFNNDLVSSADARGVMQILPGTWDWIQRTLTTGTPLAPASAADNVRGGVLLLRSLLSSTGGDPALAAAGYYQGLPSVQQRGVFPSTQQYVNSVMALAQRFGGG